MASPETVFKQYMSVAAHKPCNIEYGIDFTPIKPDLTGSKVSARRLKSEGLTPRKVYDLANGGGFHQKQCPKCGHMFRAIEVKPCKPGSMATKHVKGNACQGCTNPSRLCADAPCIGCDKATWTMPLGAEYMLHPKRQAPASERELRPGLKATWTFPMDKPRKAMPVNGPCQAVELRKEARKDKCRTCYVSEMRDIAKNQGAGFEPTVIVRKPGSRKVSKSKYVEYIVKSKATRTIIVPKVDAETQALANLMNAKPARKPRKASVKQQEHTSPVVFAAIATQAGVFDDRPFRMTVEARSVSEARKLLALCFGKEHLDGVNIYHVVDDGYGAEQLRRVA